MHSILRKLRGALGVTAAWTAAWASIGALVVIVGGLVWPQQSGYEFAGRSLARLRETADL